MPLLLRLLEDTPSWFLDGGKLGQELFAAQEQEEEGGEEGGAGGAAMATGAANERVVEECLGTLRNLAQTKTGRDALMLEVKPTIRSFPTPGPRSSQHL